MEKQIKKQALLYGLAAILFTAMLAALSYNIGLYLSKYAQPTPLTPPISVSPPALLSTFNSAEELKNFLTLNSRILESFPFYGPFDVVRLDDMVEGFSATQSSGSLTFAHSSTNVQVAGVDELDTVKTDGEYIYTLSGNTVSILRAYPPENAEKVSTIPLEGDMYPVGIFVDGNRLVVMGSKYHMPSRVYYAGFYVDIKTFVNVYDITNRAEPKFLHDLTQTGSYFNSRMIDGYVYFVVSQPAYLIYDTIILPKFYSNGQLIKEVAPSEIHYSNGSDNYYQYTTFIAINMRNDTEAPTYMTLMLGGTSSMYVSLENTYVTFHETENTTIYRVHIEANNMTAQAHGKVLGHEINQFSMDEYDNHLRIATTTWTNGTLRTNLYILNMNLTTVGKLLDIEPGETLDATRFMDNRCYLSTSVVQRDPFFVINVENASAPKILGWLKIPGFTRYLHPYDENHVISVGRNELNKVKISFFDVSNVSAPVELDSYVVEGDSTDTTVLTDHKAFLFDRGKDLLAMPVTVYFNSNGAWHQSLYVFSITLTDGLVLKGTITHQSAGVDYGDSSYVKRSLYIENVLYSISEKKIKLNDLQSLAFIKEFSLP